MIRQEKGTHKLFEQAVNPGTTCLPGFGEHINVFVRLTGQLPVVNRTLTRAKSLCFCAFFFSHFTGSLIVKSPAFIWSNNSPVRKYVRPPPSPTVGQMAFLMGRAVRGGGVYILKPPAAGSLYPPPLFQTPPNIRKVLFRGGGV